MYFFSKQIATIPLIFVLAVSWMLRRLVEEENIGVILIEHAIEFVMTVSDTIMVLNNGEVIADGAPEEIRQDKEVLEAYLGR